MEKIKIKLINGQMNVPIKKSPYSAGFDICANESKVVKSKDKALIGTGFQIQIPNNCYGRIAPRSGLATKNFIDVGAGVIDADYRGEVKVLLFNFSDEDFKVEKGDRIAQLIIEQILVSELEAVKELDKTVRNEGGFGSTGIN